MPGLSWNHELVEQLDWHWRNQLRPRLDGLTDDEYLWEPAAPGRTWSIRPRGTAISPAPIGSGSFVRDDAPDDPEPAPLTTIAWRLAHMTVEVLAMRSAGHFGRAAAHWRDWEYAPTAADALAQLDREYATWLDGVHGLGEEGLARPCGPAENGWADAPMVRLVLHINRELIHHGAEACLLRDLYLHQQG